MLKHILLDCLDTINWGTKFLSDKWLNMNKETAHTKICRSTKKFK